MQLFNAICMVAPARPPCPLNSASDTCLLSGGGKQTSVQLAVLQWLCVDLEVLRISVVGRLARSSAWCRCAGARNFIAGCDM